MFRPHWPVSCKNSESEKLTRLPEGQKVKWLAALHRVIKFESFKIALKFRGLRHHAVVSLPNSFSI
jgi:hypothetical protein